MAKKQTVSLPTSPEAREEALTRARGLIGQSLENLRTAAEIIATLQRAATKEELAAAREAADNQTAG